MSKTRKFVYQDRGIRPKNSCEWAFTPEMLSVFQSKYQSGPGPSPELRKRFCEVFNYMLKIANLYLPPKQRKIFYSVWVRSGGRKKEGIIEYSRKTGECYITNYCNYYKATERLNLILSRMGVDALILEYLKEGANDDENQYGLL